MKGYKGMSKDMTCRGMQYEIGKTYRVFGEVKLCSNGLHFCEQLKKVFYFYPREAGNRYFEVSAGGQIVSDGFLNYFNSSKNKFAASELTIVRELTDIEINKLIYGSSGSFKWYSNDGLGTGNGYGYINGSGCGNGFFTEDGNSWHNGNGFGSGYGNGVGNLDWDAYTDCTLRIEEVWLIQY